MDFYQQKMIVLTGGGTGSIIQVNAIGNGGITDFIIDDAGNSFEIGDDLVFNNANTDGGGAVAKVSLVNGGLTLKIQHQQKQKIILY